MTIQTNTTENIQKPLEVQPPQTLTEPITRPLDQVLAAIEADSRDEPVSYLDDVVVPYGGE